jgi:hypothetical protein
MTNILKLFDHAETLALNNLQDVNKKLSVYLESPFISHSDKLKIWEQIKENAWHITQLQNNKSMSAAS